MYAFLLGIHVGLAVLALLLTLVWAAFVVTAKVGPGRSSRLASVGAIASTGLVGLTGVVLAFAGGFATKAFPWIGLVAVAVHGVAGARSRWFLAADRKGAAIAAAALQVVLLLVAYGVMTSKPF